MPTIDALLDRIASLEKRLEKKCNENERLKKRVEELERNCLFSKFSVYFSAFILPKLTKILRILTAMW